MAHPPDRSRDALTAYLALAQVPGVGSQRLRLLVGAFGSAEAALQAPHAALAALPGMGKAAATAIRAASPSDGERLLAGAVARRAVVVSGMARGIDAIAHGAALDAGGASVGVLGNGFGVIYPAANRALYERMVRHGCLITEHPPGERPHAGSFPRRNRLIAGLARAVVVVEAAAQSGAITTADAGLEQGRAILAVPGPITSPTSVGCNKLIQQGAHSALCAADILEAVGLAGGLADTALALATPAPRVPPPDLSGLQLTLWSRLTTEPQHVDALVAVAHTAAADVLGALTELELRGLVRQGPGMVFGLT